MEKAISMIREANKALKTADHMLYVTMPVVNDNKIMMLVTENLCKAVVGAMDVILYYDRLYKRIGPHGDAFQMRYETFKNKCAARYNFSNENVALIRDIRKIMEARKKSPIEFSRRDSFVICSPSYRTETITIERLKNFMNQSKEFISKVNRIIEQNVRGY